MHSVNIETRPNRPIASLRSFFSSVFKPDLPIMTLIIMGVFIWFCLAQFIVYLIPDSETDIAGNMGQYLAHIYRNGKIYLFFILGLKLVEWLRAYEQDKNVPPKTFVTSRLKQFYHGPKTTYIAAVLYFFIAIILFATYLYAYSTIKTRIPNINPYSWDAYFQKLDQFLFFGHDPWQYFAWLYNYPLIIHAIDYLYDIWATIMVVTWFFVLRYGGDDKVRRGQYVLTLLLTWFIGGNLLAILFSSGGPVYYGALTGLPDVYAEQLASLSLVNDVMPLRSFQYQHMLWQVFESPSIGLGGISAMPSMHCASAFLLLLMFGRTKASKILLSGFLIFILLSSFILAWHYAVDGLLGILVTYLCWRLSGFLINKFT